MPKKNPKTYVGKTFHSTALIIETGIGGKNREYICMCKQCGNVYFNNLPALRIKTESGCNRCGIRLRRKIGDLVNGFAVVGMASESGKNKIYYFQCNHCCNSIACTLSEIKSRKSTHCGCLGSFSGRHNKCTSHEYKCWSNMKTRILYEKGETYKHYVLKRKLDIDPNWLLFDNFYKDMGDAPSPTHSIERVDNTKGYWPSNCVWATPAEQARNTSRTVWCMYENQKYCLKDLCLKLNIRYNTIVTRRHRGIQNPFEASGIVGVTFL